MSNAVINANAILLNNHNKALKSPSVRQSNSLEKASSDVKVKPTSDKATDLAISEDMRAEIKGLELEERNTQEGISIVQVAKGALQEMQSILQRVQELSTKVATENLSASDESTIQIEISFLMEKLENISETTEFNGTPLLDTGTAIFSCSDCGGDCSSCNSKVEKYNASNLGNWEEMGYLNRPNANDIHIKSAEENVIIKLPNFNTFVDDKFARPLVKLLNSYENSMPESYDQIKEWLKDIDGALEDLSKEYANLDITQERLEYLINKLEMTKLEMESKNANIEEPRLRNAEMAQEVMQQTQANILDDVTISMLAQANQVPQAVSLLLE